MAISCMVQIGEIDLFTFIRCTGILKWIRILCARRNNLATLFRNLVSFPPAAMEFMGLECAQKALG